jgi:hypothetical protein
MVGVTCAICERSLLPGEEPLRFSPDGRDYLDVCPLCQQTALEYGWFREGGPSVPTIETVRRRSFLGALLRPRGQHAETVEEPLMRRLSRPEKAIVEAAQLFNESQFRRTIEGIARSLGPPNVSIVRLSGLNAEVVITIAWEISWYQYRVGLDSSQPLRLAERGSDPEELSGPFDEWNADLTEDGRIVPDVART